VQNRFPRGQLDMAYSRARAPVPATKLSNRLNHSIWPNHIERGDSCTGPGPFEVVCHVPWASVHLVFSAQISTHVDLQETLIGRQYKHTTKTCGAMSHEFMMWHTTGRHKPECCELAAPASIDGADVRDTADRPHLRRITSVSCASARLIACALRRQQYVTIASSCKHFATFCFTDCMCLGQLSDVYRMHVPRSAFGCLQNACASVSFRMFTDCMCLGQLSDVYRLHVPRSAFGCLQNACASVSFRMFTDCMCLGQLSDVYRMHVPRSAFGCLQNACASVSFRMFSAHPVFASSLFL
jgi:hypothetical protein